jgi:hypothetical protein
MNKDEQIRFKDELHYWLDANAARHCAEPLVDLENSIWGIHDTLKSLEQLLDDISDYEQGNARLMRGSFRYFSEKQITNLLKKKHILTYHYNTLKDIANTFNDVSSEVNNDT